jgi:hypothetical protein
VFLRPLFSLQTVSQSDRTSSKYFWQGGSASFIDDLVCYKCVTGKTKTLNMPRKSRDLHSLLLSESLLKNKLRNPQTFRAIVGLGKTMSPRHCLQALVSYSYRIPFAEMIYSFFV